MRLVIVESPTKTKSLSKYLGSDFKIMASMGHVRDLPESKFGIEIKEKGKAVYDFIPEYKVMKGKDEQVSLLEKEAKKASEIILASDPDREGEAIAWHVSSLLRSSLKKGTEVKRITFHSITKEAILEALDNPRQVDMNLVNAQQARRFLDRLVGYKLSPILWKKVRRGLSAGRVQSVAVRLIVEREREIQKFKPVEYWEISALVTTKNGKAFEIQLAKIDNKKAVVNSGEIAGRVVSDLEKGEYEVSKLTKTERHVAPHPPFKTSTLQQAAANAFGWSAKRTMNVAQRLYEQGDITYHRTDSLNLVDSAIDQIRKQIESEYGATFVSNVPRVYKASGKVVAQEAHEAVRPTNVSVTPGAYKGQDGMMADQSKLYSLIWRRTVACQMNDAIFDDTGVSVLCGKYLLTGNGNTIKFEGWKKLFPKENGEAQIIPEVIAGEKLKKEKVLSEQKFTQPPARYNDASLIRELEKRGIGRPSTYAAIISTIQDRRYVEQRERRFFATSIGEAVTDFLMKNFPTEMEYEFTAKMEDDLDLVADGKENWEKMLSNFWDTFKDRLAIVDKESARVAVPTISTGKKCPECKTGEVVIRDGKFGKFLSCDKYPECKYTDQYIEYVDGVTCEKCGKRVVLKKTKTGRDFYGCEDYPNCTWASWHKPQQKGEVETAS